jgi:bacteriocin-like protein
MREMEKAIGTTELTDEELDRVSGGLNFWKAIFIGGTSSAPGGTGTDSGPTATNAQAWVVSVS